MNGFLDFKIELEKLINTHGVDNELRTPDFILADYVMDCLQQYGKLTLAREKWFGRVPKDLPPPNVKQ